MLRTEKNVTASAYHHHAYMLTSNTGLHMLKGFWIVIGESCLICELVALLKISFFISGN